MTAAEKELQLHLNDLQPDANNSNRGTARGQKMIIDSIQSNKFGRSIVVDKNNKIIGGNKTVEAVAEVLGTEAEVKVIETNGEILIVHKRNDLDLDDPDPNNPARKLAYQDNLTSHFSFELDPEIVLADLEAGFDFEALELSLPDLGKLLDDPAFGLLEGGQDTEPQIDKADELRQKWGVEPGQLWQLEEHKLICGDSTDPDIVTQLMADERAILFATDPPYLVDYDGTNHPHKWNEPDKNKDWSDQYQDWDNSAQGKELYTGFVKVAIEHAIEPNAAWYCWHASRNQAMLEEVWEEYGAFVHQQIIWAKDRPILTRSWYMWQHEPCFFGWVRGSKPPRVAPDYPKSVWEIPTIQPGTSTDHPTSKPIELFEIPIQQHTKKGDICYEPFTGSGSQLIAAENLGRVFRGIELNPGFVAVTLQRWADHTGKMPELTE